MSAGPGWWRGLPRRLLLLVLVPLLLVVIGTVGYYTLEKNYTLFDAL